MKERIDILISQSWFIKFISWFKNPVLFLYILIGAYLTWIVFSSLKTGSFDYKFFIELLVVFWVVKSFKRDKEQQLFDIFCIYLIVRVALSMLSIFLLLSPSNKGFDLFPFLFLISILPCPEFFIRNNFVQQMLTTVRFIFLCTAFYILKTKVTFI